MPLGPTILLYDKKLVNTSSFNNFLLTWQMFLHEKNVILIIEPPHDKTNKTACAPSKDSDQPGHPPSLISLRCPHEESLGPKLPSECTVKTLIRLGGCPGRSESSLGAYAISLVLSRGSSIRHAETEKQIRWVFDDNLEIIFHISQ